MPKRDANDVAAAEGPDVLAATLDTLRADATPAAQDWPAPVPFGVAGEPPPFPAGLSRPGWTPSQAKSPAPWKCRQTCRACVRLAPWQSASRNALPCGSILVIRNR